MKPYLICYDIQENYLRTKIGNKIIEYGLDRINKSVYLSAISESSLTTLENWLQQQMQAKGMPDDSLITLPLAAHEVQSLRVYGRNDLDKAELTGTKSTLII